MAAFQLIGAPALVHDAVVTNLSANVTSKSTAAAASSGGLLKPSVTGVPASDEISADFAVTCSAGDIDMYTLLTSCMDGQLEQGEAYLVRSLVGKEEPCQGTIVAAIVTTGRYGEEGSMERRVLREFRRDENGTIRLKAHDLLVSDICGPEANGDDPVGITIMGTLYSTKPARRFVRITLNAPFNA